MELQHYYVIDTVENDAPYFEFAYVKRLISDTEIEWTRSEKDALRTNDKELLLRISKAIHHYANSGKTKRVDIRPWFYKVLDNGDIEKKRTLEKDLL